MKKTMNEEEIKNLSRRISDAVEKRILKDHYIVPKPKARELCKLTFENDGSVDYGLIDGLIDWVEDNFGDEYRDIMDKGK